MEKRRVLWVTNRSVSASGWCGSCAARVTFVTPEEAARITGIAARAIYRGIEASELHFMETGEGELLVCRNSL